VEDRRRVRKYGLAPGEFEKMWKKQKGRCACCGKRAKRLIVDHDHQTNEVRGLLCYRCNMGLGHYERDRDLYEAYLAGYY